MAIVFMEDNVNGESIEFLTLCCMSQIKQNGLEDQYKCKGDKARGNPLYSCLRHARPEVTLFFKEIR